MDRHITEVHKEEKSYECDACPQRFSRLSNLKRHQETESHTFKYHCQFCHDDGLYFKSETEARKHFIFKPRSSCVSKRSTTVYSCIVYEKRMKEGREKKRRDELEKERIAAEEDLQKWTNMTEAEKEQERKLHRERNIEYWTMKASMWQNPEEEREGMLNAVIESCRTENLTDEKMAKVMANKWVTRVTSL